MRIGNGYDVHRLVEHRALILGGVEVPHNVGLLGHSDADVLVHALMDSILGAMAKGDIGKHFPDNDDRYKGISSISLLKEVRKIMQENEYKIGNVDCIVIAQAPKLAPFIYKMRENIADALECEIDKVNVKATTTEHLSFEGEGLGISSHCVCILERS